MDSSNQPTPSPRNQCRRTKKFRFPKMFGDYCPNNAGRTLSMHCFFGRFLFLLWPQTHRILGTGIYAYIYHKNQPNVGIQIPYMDPMGNGMSFRGFVVVPQLASTSKLPVEAFTTNHHCTTSLSRPSTRSEHSYHQKEMIG